MSTVTVYGASDDLIEVEGDIREEFDGPGYLAFDNGTILSVQYSNEGVWRIHCLIRGHESPGENGLALVTIERCSGHPTNDIYSDRATVRGDFTCVVFGEQIARLAAGAFSNGEPQP